MQWEKQCFAGWRVEALLGPVDGNESWALKWMGDSATSLQCKSWPVQWSTNRLQHGKDQVDLRDNINFRRKHESRKIMKIVMSVGLLWSHIAWMPDSSCIALKRFKLLNIMLRSERIPSSVKMMLKVIDIAYFYIDLFICYTIFATLQSNCLLKIIKM